MRRTPPAIGRDASRLLLQLNQSFDGNRAYQKSTGNGTHGLTFGHRLHQTFAQVL